MVVIAHPDDEVIGAGATLAKYVRKGFNVWAVCMTDGVSARGRNTAKAKSRKDAANLAASEIGFQWIYKGNFPDNSMDAVPFIEIVKIVEKYKDELNPNIVFTHSPSDLNIDHRITANAVLTAFRPIPGQVTPDLFAMEVPSATDFGHPDFFGIFKPNYFVDISETWSFKLKALNVYHSEILPKPHSRSISGIEALSTLRGHQVGLNQAEAFQLLRKLEIG